MDVKLCNWVSKFKMLDTKSGMGMPKTTQALSWLFLTNHSRDCSELFFDMMSIDIKYGKSCISS